MVQHNTSREDQYLAASIVASELPLSLAETSVRKSAKKKAQSSKKTQKDILTKEEKKILRSVPPKPTESSHAATTHSKPEYFSTAVTASSGIQSLPHEQSVDFVTIISHQLRTPLTAIKWHVNVLLSGQIGKLQSRQQDFLLDIYHANDRMIRLIDNLLIIEQLERESFVMVPRTVFISQIISKVVEESETIARQNGVTLVGQCPNNQGAKMKIDPIYFRLACKNIIDNALRYTHKGGTVSVECEYITPEQDQKLDTPAIRITIQDTGIGIPTEDTRLVFNKFYRSARSMKTQTEGSGLGLYITKVIIEKSGGTVWFDTSENGTTFYIQLPLE